MLKMMKECERMMDFWKDEPGSGLVFSEKEIRTFVISAIAIILVLIVLGIGIIGLVFKILLEMAGGL